MEKKKRRRGSRGRRGTQQTREQRTETTRKRLMSQSENHLKKQFKPGESRHEAKYKNDRFNQRVETIHSYKTFENYKNTQKNFINWGKENIKDFDKIQSFRQLEKHVPEFLADCEKRGLSRQTVKTYRTGLSRLYESATDYEVKTQKDGLRGDVPREHHKHFSEQQNKELVEISKGTGLRISELRNLKVSDCKKIGNNWVVDVKGQYAKGGRGRKVVVSDKYQNTFEKVITDKKKELDFIENKLNNSNISDKERKRLQHDYNRANKVINQKLHSAMNIHGNRREYANDMLAQVRNNTRELNKINQLTNIPDRHKNTYESKIKSDFYKSDKYDINEKRDDLWTVSHQLGHSRLDVVVKSYLKK